MKNKCHQKLAELVASSGLVKFNPSEVQNVMDKAALTLENNVKHVRSR